MHLTQKWFAHIGLLFALLVGACSTNIQNGYQLPKSPTIGLATGSITYTGMLGMRIVKFRNTVTGKEYAASVGASQSLIPFAAPEIEDDIGEIGGLFALELPAGTYSVYSWGIKQGEWFLAPMKAFDIPFTIEAGSSVYLGNFHIEQTDKKLFRTGAAKMSLRNNASRDIPALQKRFTVFQTLPISTVIAADANFEELGSGSKGKFEFSGPLFVPNYKPK